MAAVTAADGKTPVESIPGGPLMVSAVEFNKLYAQLCKAELSAADNQARFISWRNLALQYDQQRMSAMWWLRAVLAGTAKMEEIEKFLESVPVSGDIVLKQRIEEMLKEQQGNQDGNRN